MLKVFHLLHFWYFKYICMKHDTTTLFILHLCGFLCVNRLCASSVISQVAYNSWTFVNIITFY